MKKMFPCFFAVFIGCLVVFVGCSSEHPGKNKPTKKPLSPEAKLYNTYCATCHGKDGKLGFSGATDLTTSTVTLDEAIEQITNGKGTMVGFKGVISKEDIAAIAKYTLGLRQ